MGRWMDGKCVKMRERNLNSEGMMGDGGEGFWDLIHFGAFLQK
jgi:hypothetical protein